MTHETAANRLKIVSIVTALSGVPFLLAALPGLRGIANLFLDFVFFPIDGSPKMATPDARLFAAICGGLTVGIGVMVWMIADKLYVRDPATARAIILTGLGAWCAADSLGSIAAGAPMNAAVNALILAAFVWSLRSSRQLSA